MSHSGLGDILCYFCIAECFGTGFKYTRMTDNKEDATKKGEHKEATTTAPAKKKEEEEPPTKQQQQEERGGALIEWINHHGHTINVLATAAVEDHNSRLLLIYLDKNAKVLACDHLSDAIATAMFPDEYPSASASAILTAHEDNAKAKAAGGTGKEFKWCVLTAFIDSTKEIVWSAMPFQKRYMHLKRTADSSVHQLSFTEVVHSVLKPLVVIT
jgi:hypothetical protein